MIISAVVLSALFAITGVLSALVGLGGGSFYLAFMELFALPHTVIPILALTSNILVSGTGTIARIIYKETIPTILMIQILIPSMSMAYVGASIALKESAFRIIINVTLLVVIIIRVLLQHHIKTSINAHKNINSFSHPSPSQNGILKRYQYVVISALVGFISGIIGIGGGIILGPILYLAGIDYKKIPLITSLYIFLNSIVGLIAHLQKIEEMSISIFQEYIHLPIISLCVSIVSMKYFANKISSEKIKLLVLSIIMVICIYNLYKLGVSYVN